MRRTSTLALAESVAPADPGNERDEIVRTFVALDARAEAEILAGLDGGETQVFLQIMFPNRAGWLYAIAEQGGNGTTEDVNFGPSHITVEYKHMAYGLGMDLKSFEEFAMRIRAKIEAYIETVTPVAYPDRSILRQLESVFGLPRIPLNLDVNVLRRLLTLTACAHATKVTPKVAAMLDAVGAKVSQPAPHVARRVHAAPTT